jgi:hypothetical protein
MEHLMSWSYRKSVGLGHGGRLNFSKSGVGVSYGTKGYRISTGPRGTYVTLGFGGVRYRHRLDDPGSHSPSQARYPQHSDGYANSNDTAYTIETANARQLIDDTSQETLSRINTCIQKSSYAWIVLVVGSFISGLLALIHPLLGLTGFALIAYASYATKDSDLRRKTYPLFFELDDEANARWNELEQSLLALSNSQIIWSVQGGVTTSDWKRNAGATNLLNRQSVSSSRKSPKFIATNVVPYCIKSGRQEFYFLPDRLYVYEAGCYGAVDYSLLNVEDGASNFIESATVPRDTQVVGSTWQYVNKNGGPDRRFSNNRQLPVVLYGMLSLFSSTGLNILLYVSSVQAAVSFASGFAQSRNYKTKRQQSRSQPVDSPYPADFDPFNPTGQQPKTKQGRPVDRKQNQSQQNNSQTKPKQDIPLFYNILDLQLTCTREEASLAYRRLAKSYHPDTVHHLPPEFRAIAEERMREINQAYEELKHARKW